ncbi:MAG: UvrD-helicase domain-containing protein [Phycisphaerae bacterium]|nr:UvrD-helicase domain-containing protein [Phycisphaerae bacterium]
MAKEKQTIRWTQAQQRAIETVGRDVLVTASAGTGKTAVLSARVVERICDSADPAQADSLLVLTFTDAAAEEMRSRIAETLRKRYAAERNGALRQQLLLLDRSYISTIHAFCKRILTEFFYLIDLDPTFGILDADEQRLLKTELLDKTLQQAWADEPLAKGLETLFEGRRIQPGRGSFVDRILPLSEFLDSVVSRNAFYQRAAVLNDRREKAHAELKNIQKDILLEKLAACQSRLDYAMQLDAAHCGGQYATDHIHSEILAVILSCTEFLKQDRFDACAELLGDLKFSQLRKKKNVELSPDEQAQIKAPVDKTKKELKALSDFAVLCSDYESVLAPQVSLQTNVLLELLKRFDTHYTAAKQARNVLDFADLEHAMLRLVETKPEVAQTLKERFAYLFVDEYQDINAVQQRIIEALSRDDNVFVVGDIKQSIYGFRQSKPEIFLQHLQNAADIAESSTKPGRVDLQDNFRCRDEIIEFINVLFANVMTKAVADMDYDEKAKLKTGYPYPPFKATDGPNHPIELYLLDEDSTEDDTQNEEAENSGVTESISAAQRQAAFIARRIQQIVGANSGKPEFSIYNKKADGYRPVQYRDIVILMRSLSHKAQDYVEMLRLAGVPVSSQSACGYFEATEISDCLCLLKVLDNGDRDIELAAVLRGPVFGLTDSALAAIRLHSEEISKSEIRNPKQIQNSNTKCSKQKQQDKKSTSNPLPPSGYSPLAGGELRSFYQAVLTYTKNGPDKTLQEKLNEILAQLTQWRRQVRRGSLADLLDTIFRTKRLLSFYSALPNGAQRRANLLKLHDHAIQFEHFRTTEPGAALGRFVEFLEKLADAEQDWAPAEPDSSSENAVRIMSVHKSKGLEFPVVFLAELNTPFNRRSQSGPCLIDEQTVGLQIIDCAARGRFSSLAHQVIAERQKKADLAEEMRILYVALTRAREKLILTASRKENACVNLLSECAGFDENLPASNRRYTLPDWKLTEAGCHLDWLLMGMARKTELCRLFNLDGSESDSLFCAGRIGRDELDILTNKILVAKKSLKSEMTPPKAGTETANQAQAAFESIRDNLLWEYPFADVTRVGAKLSVSELTHRDDEFSNVDFSRAFAKQPAAVSESSKSSVGADALSLGSAVHLIVEHIDLSRAVDAASLEKTIADLVKKQLLNDAMTKQIDVSGILSFFNSDLGQLAQTAGNNVLREWPFTYALDAVNASAKTTGEIIVLQGIVDMIIPTENGLVIVDFKTDRVDEETMKQRAEQYAEQLRSYGRAAGDILNQPVRSAWLYFLTPQKAVEMTL